MTASTAPEETGRRSGLRGRRVTADVALAVVLPTVAVVALLLVRPAKRVDPDRPRHPTGNPVT